MRILFVVDFYPPHIGGVETLFSNLAEGLVKKGNKCIVLTSKLKNTKKFEFVKGVEIHRVWIPSFAKRLFFGLFSIPKAITLGKQADIIHSSTYPASLSGYLSAKLNKKKSVFTVHEVFSKLWFKLQINKMHSIFGYLIEKFSLGLDFDKYICVSRSTARELGKIGIDKEKIKVIHNFLEYEHINFDKKRDIKKDLNLKNKFVYLYYGRPGISKGTEYLILASKLIKKKIKDSKLVMIMPEKPHSRHNKMIKLIKENQLENNIIILDSMNRRKLFSYIKTSNCVVVPSLSEGFGFCVAETNYLGTPVVASNVASIPEVISGKYILVQPQSPEAIERGVIDVKNKKYKQTKMKFFNKEKTIKEYMLEYGK